MQVRGAGVRSNLLGERGRHHSAWLLERDRGLFEKIFDEVSVLPGFTAHSFVTSRTTCFHTVSYLKSALERGGIRTFVDFTLDGGVWFRPAINEAIEQSEIAIVVVPQNFHFSAWCLNKLVKINKLMEKRNRRFAQTSTGRLQIFQYTRNN